VIAGNWSANIRLSCAQGGDTKPQAGNLTADIIKRAFKYVVASETYIPIFVTTFSGQSLTPAYTTYALPARAGIEMPFEQGTLLYIDEWANITQNANNNPLQDIRSNRHSTDTTGKTGDGNASITAPGFVAISSTTPATITVSGLLTDTGADLLRDGLTDRTIPLISYIAVGSGNNVASTGDTQLQAEVSRIAITTTAKGIKTGELLVSMSLDATAMGIQEVAVFGGLSASSTANSGILLARGVCHSAVTGPATLQLDIIL
jgi:hypothetical protein